MRFEGFVFPLRVVELNLLRVSALPGRKIVILYIIIQVACGHAEARRAGVIDGLHCGCCDIIAVARLLRVPQIVDGTNFL